ncbi:MAG: hypothetical protein KGL39_44830 [Patescibacteria group bacterium]|nr:hypothetical protein [Patescibacteria group bacterium]
MSRAAVRQHLRAVEKTRERRARGELSAATKARLAIINVRPIEDAGDQAFVVHMKRAWAERHGLPTVAWTAGAVFFVAKHALSGERLGCMAVTVTQPQGKFFVEDFFTIDGRGGRIAAMAMIEALRGLKGAKLGMIAFDNPHMLRTLERYGMRVVGYLVEGG